MLASKPCFSTQNSSVTRFIFIVESIPHKKEQNQAQKYDLFFLHSRKIVQGFSTSYYNVSKVESPKNWFKIVL